ncbi:ATP synthase subunit gamma, mitochondrial, partial [Ophiophagus hannah]
MIDKLTLRFNRTRQAVITKELIEIISGAAALLRIQRNSASEEGDFLITATGNAEGVTGLDVISVETRVLFKSSMAAIQIGGWTRTHSLLTIGPRSLRQFFMPKPLLVSKPAP